MKCGNCGIEMIKGINPITFHYGFNWSRYYWGCPRCGAIISREPEESEVNMESTNKSYTYTDRNMGMMGLTSY